MTTLTSASVIVTAEVKELAKSFNRVSSILLECINEASESKKFMQDTVSALQKAGAALQDCGNTIAVALSPEKEAQSLVAAKHALYEISDTLEARSDRIPGEFSRVFDDLQKKTDKTIDSVTVQINNFSVQPSLQGLK